MENEVVALRRWFAALTVSWILSFALLLGWFSRAEVLQCRRLEILNVQGKTVAVVGSNPQGGGVVMLYDGAGRLRAAIGLTEEESAAVDLCGSDGRTKVSLEVRADGKVSVKGLR